MAFMTYVTVSVTYAQLYYYFFVVVILHTTK